MPHRHPRYTLVRLVALEELLGGIVPKLRLQFRGARVHEGERVLMNGTLGEAAAHARAAFGEDAAQDVMDQAVALQRGDVS